MPFSLWVAWLGEWSPSGTSAHPCPPSCAVPNLPNCTRRPCFSVAERTQEREKSVCSLSFCISLSRAPLSDKEGEVRVGWGGQGSGSRACGGQRAGLESFQALLCKHTCVLWVHIIYPSRANSPLYPWVPAPACVHTLPPGWPPPRRAPLNPTLPSSPPSCFPPHPRPQNSPACHVRTVPANTLGRVPGRRNLS